jgi:iron complex outermembrane receptor protein
MVLAQLSGVLDGAAGAVGQNTLPAAAYPTVAQAVITGLLTPLGAGALAPAIAANLKAAHIETPINASELTSLDLFADATYAFTDRFEMAAGIRYTHDEKTAGFASPASTTAARSSAPCWPRPAPCPRPRSRRFLRRRSPLPAPSTLPVNAASRCSA